MTHRSTVQFDAKLAVDLHLPADDVALIRDRTRIRVVVEPPSAADDCSHDWLKIRLGEGEAAQDYEQARFVHQSAATGAATCLLNYLTSKKKLSVDADVFGTAPLGLDSTDGHTFVPVGWTVARIEGKRVVATHGERLDAEDRRRVNRADADGANSRRAAAARVGSARLELSPLSEKGRTVMAKGNQKPKKEVKKPKQDKAPKK